MERLTEVVTDTFGKTRVVLSEPSKNSICGGCRFPNECDRCSLYKAVKKLNAIEDILNGYDINRLKELVEADRRGLCVVLNSGYTETAGGEALRQAMYLCSVTNNEVTRYTADAIAEKVVREEAEYKLQKTEKVFLPCIHSKECDSYPQCSKECYDEP